MSLTMTYERNRAHTTWRRRPYAVTGCQEEPRREEASMLEAYARKRVREKMEDEAFTAGIAVAQETTEARFLRLAKRWSHDVGPISSIDQRISHPDYRQIVAMGWDVVPHLIADLQTTRRFWFPALQEITGIRPFDRGDIGSVRRMTEAWTKWWEKRKNLM